MPDYDGSFDTQIEQGTGMAKTCGLEQLHAYKGKHAGKRAFILGNGPSLSIEELDTMLQLAAAFGKCT